MEPVDQQRQIALPELGCDLPRRVDDPSGRPQENGHVLVDDVGSELAGGLRTVDQLLDEGAQPRAGPGDQLLGAQVRAENLREATVVGLQTDDVREICEEALPGVVLGECSLGGRRHALEVILEDGVDQGVFRREATVESSDADTGPARDLLDAGVDAVLRERSPCCFENAFAVLTRIAAQWATTGICVSGGCDPLMIPWRG